MCRIDFHALLMSNFEHRAAHRAYYCTVQRCAQEDCICIAIKNRRREPGRARDRKILSDTGCYVLSILRNIPVVHDVYLHALLLNNFERRILRIERTNVHSRGTSCSNTFLCSVVSGAFVLSKTVETFFIARFVRFYLQGASTWPGVYKNLSTSTVQY